MSEPGLPATDRRSTVQSLREQVERFVAQRDWHQFHSPKNLSMSLAIEAAELMEHFQWIGCEESRQCRAAGRLAIEEELADVLCYVLALANEMEIDLSAALQGKMQRNAEKYPVSEYRGRFGAADSRPVSRQ